MKLRIADRDLDVRPGGEGLMLDGAPSGYTLVRARPVGESLELLLRAGSRPVKAWATPDPAGGWVVQLPGGRRTVVTPGGAAAAIRGPYGPVQTPIAGVVTALLVAEGQLVAAGEALAVVEAMKMRFTLEAEAAGVVLDVQIREQTVVSANQVLMHLKP